MVKPKRLSICPWKKKFRGAHVHSIVKKKRLRDKKFEKEYLEVRSDFHLDIFDRTLINMVKNDDWIFSYIFVNLQIVSNVLK